MIGKILRIDDIFELIGSCDETLTYLEVERSLPPNTFCRDCGFEDRNGHSLLCGVSEFDKLLDRKRRHQEVDAVMFERGYPPRSFIEPGSVSVAGETYEW